MIGLFYLAAGVALLATVLVITRSNAVHALLYFVVSLFAVALVFFLLGAPFIAALEVIVYAGAIMVLFVFVVMLLNLGKKSEEQERAWQRPGMWVGPSVLSAILFVELAWILSTSGDDRIAATVVGPAEVGRVLMGPYVLGVEMASMLLLAGLIGAYHLGRKAERAGAGH
jgi:NADH-quinone oxidoreductase subunit J